MRWNSINTIRPSTFRNLRKNKLKYRDIYSIIKKKKKQLLQEECEIVKKIPQLDIIRQIYNQIPLSYELNSDTNFISFGWKPTKEYIKSGGWKCLQFMMVNFMETY